MASVHVFAEAKDTVPPAECLAGGFILSHAEIAEYAEPAGR